jgi:hypothetical protein
LWGVSIRSVDHSAQAIQLHPKSQTSGSPVARRAVQEDRGTAKPLLSWGCVVRRGLRVSRRLVAVAIALNQAILALHPLRRPRQPLDLELHLHCKANHLGGKSASGVFCRGAHRFIMWSGRGCVQVVVSIAHSRDGPVAQVDRAAAF